MGYGIERLHNYKKLAAIVFIVAFAVVLLVPILTPTVHAQNTYTCSFSSGSCVVKNNNCDGAYFPGVCRGSTPGECIGSGGSCTQTTQLVSRTTNLYNTALAFGAILALGVIVYGGVRYSASAGNPSGIGEAKKWVTAGLLGLLLLFSSFLILNTINPALTEPEDPLLPRQESEDPDLIDVGDGDFSIFGCTEEGLGCSVTGSICCGNMVCKPATSGSLVGTCTP